MYELTSHCVFLFLEYLPENGRKTSKDVELQNAFILLYLIKVQLSEYIMRYDSRLFTYYVTQRNLSLK